MALGGRRAGETTFEEEADLVTVPGAHLTAEGRKKKTSSVCLMSCPLDHGMQGFMGTSKAVTIFLA